MRALSVVLFALVTSGFGTATLAQDASIWSGPYAGLSYSGSDGSNYYPEGDLTGDDPEYSLSGETTGLFGGYNWTQGPWVYGAEVSVVSGSVSETGLDGTPYPEYEFTRLVDLKGRVGYATGKTLFYGTLGYSTADFSLDGDEDYTSTGWLFGLGADFQVSNRLFLGIELSRRDLSNSYPINSTIDTVTIRGGITF